MIDFQEEVDEKIRDVVVFLTYKSAIPLSAKRIQKLAYLAELRAIEKWGHRLTGAKFINYKFGPWSPEVALASEEAPELREETKQTAKGKGRFFSPAKSKAKLNALDKSEIGLLKEVISDWIRVPTDALVAATKTTPPFIWTERFGDTVPFQAYETFASALSKARSNDFEGDVIKNEQDLETFVKNL
jgi:uncharacterized phage-associated protein